jgi:MFS family permease
MPAEATRSPYESLLRHPDFLRLWVGQSVSLLGAQIGGLALPLTAAVVLEASPLQMGLLGAAGSAPSLLVGLFAGPWVDRRARRPVLVQTNALRALLLATIPLAAALGQLGMPHLYLVAFFMGGLAVFFDVAYQSFLPSLVGSERLVEGNGKLAMSASVVQFVGPGLAAFLVKVASAPLAIAFDAVSFAASSLVLGRIRSPEALPPPSGRNLRADIAEGLSLVLRNPFLRSVAARNLTFNLFLSMWGAVYVLFVTRDLGFRETELGLISAAGGPMALLAASLAPRLQARYGIGRSLLVSAAVEGTGTLLMATAGGAPGLALGMLVASRVTMGLASTVYGINQISLRQGITPNRLLGRVNATMRFLALGVTPLGALMGGWLGEVLGLRQTMLLAACGALLGTLLLAFSPVRDLKEPPLDDSLEAAPAPRGLPALR